MAVFFTTVVIVRGIPSTFSIGQERRCLKCDIGEVCLRVLCSIVTENMADGHRNALIQDID